MAANRRKHRGGEIVINPERTRYDEHARLFDQHVSAKRPTRTSWWTAAAKRTITFTLAEWQRIQTLATRERAMKNQAHVRCRECRKPLTTCDCGIDTWTLLALQDCAPNFFAPLNGEPYIAWTEDDREFAKGWLRLD